MVRWVGRGAVVASGLPLRAQLTGPDDKIIYAGERETDSQYTFAAHATGVYKCVRPPLGRGVMRGLMVACVRRHRYCFSNKMSSVTPKLVVFSLVIGDAPVPSDNNAGAALTHSHPRRGPAAALPHLSGAPPSLLPAQTTTSSRTWLVARPW